MIMMIINLYGGTGVLQMIIKTPMAPPSALIWSTLTHRVSRASSKTWFNWELRRADLDIASKLKRPGFYKNLWLLVAHWPRCELGYNSRIWLYVGWGHLLDNGLVACLRKRSQYHQSLSTLARIFHFHPSYRRNPAWISALIELFHFPAGWSSENWGWGHYRGYDNSPGIYRQVIVNPAAAPYLD